MLKPSKGRILVKCDRDFKNNHTLLNEKGEKVNIRLERNVENLNHRETMPIQATCLYSEIGIPVGATVLCHHNTFHPSNEIFNHTSLSGEEIANNIGIYAIPENEAYLWKTVEMKEWESVKGFAIAERVFQPYNGSLHGIPPTKIKEVLYVKTGHFKGKAVKTLKACDYEMVFRGDNGKEQRLIRIRTSYPEPSEREEVVAVLENETNQIKKGKLLVGLNEKNCKPIQ